MANWNLLRVAGRELAAFGRQALLLPRDTGRADIPSDLAPGQDLVICMHGLFATAGVLRPMRAAIEAHSSTAALTYPVGPGVEDLTARLDELLNTLPDDLRLHLVGHSVGGIVVRHYATTRSDPRLVQTVSLAAPFAGLRGARMFGLAIARDIDPSSPLLRKVRMNSLEASSVPHLSIVAHNDQVVTKAVSHTLPGGDVQVIADCGHNALLFDEMAITHVCKRVAERLTEKDGETAVRPS